MRCHEFSYRMAMYGMVERVSHWVNMNFSSCGFFSRFFSLGVASSRPVLARWPDFFVAGFRCFAKRFMKLDDRFAANVWHNLIKADQSWYDFIEKELIETSLGTALFVLGHSKPAIFGIKWDTEAQDTQHAARTQISRISLEKVGIRSWVFKLGCGIVQGKHGRWTHFISSNQDVNANN